MIGFLCVLAAAGLIVALALEGRWLFHLPSLRAMPPPAAGTAPRLSIIIPARNEEMAIARSVTSAASQAYPDLEVIVVDDGSTDATPRILASLRDDFGPRLSVHTGRPLAPGWVGKCNACDHGASFARGDWLLFLDADTDAATGLSAALLAVAVEQRLDAVSVQPFVETGTLAERLALPAFFRFAMNVFPAMRRFDPEMPERDALANGQCFLFRTSAYRAVGGHAAVRDKVLEDVELAHLVRRSGLRYALLTGYDLIRVRMYRAASEVVDGMGKHAAAGMRLSANRGFLTFASLFATTVGPSLLCLAGAAIAAAGDPSGVFGLAAGLGAWAYSAYVWQRASRPLFGLPAAWALAAPMGLLTYGLIAAWGMLRSALGLGVRWKGRVYKD
ncbi:MAG TPA: glycosyltransferase family 2 protein [Thermoflexales bacterium]|nr:glycosyltransferase family 2 protein [Thermoflexales bacterium]HQY25101.1 glycosyltransferase family 2 protein [Thermoflexales bacterium]HRA55050.1 glycosyltransferase family 2 protein [Thermoflexales bacterium]